MAREFTLTQRDDGAYTVSYSSTRFRFLLDDGRVVDVAAWRDDSDLRAEVLKVTGANRIEGVAEVPAQGSLVS